MRLVIDGYPVMDETDYLNEITKAIEEKRALTLKEDNVLIGAMTFSRNSGSIDFFRDSSTISQSRDSEIIFRSAFGKLFTWAGNQYDHLS